MSDQDRQFAHVARELRLMPVPDGHLKVREMLVAKAEKLWSERAPVADAEIPDQSVSRPTSSASTALSVPAVGDLRVLLEEYPPQHKSHCPKRSTRLIVRAGEYVRQGRQADAVCTCGLDTLLSALSSTTEKDRNDAR